MAIRIFRRLRDLLDVDTSGASVGDALVLDADGETWVPGSAGGGGGAPSGPAGGVLSGTYPDPGFAVDMATQAELDAHVNDTSDAHDASAISIADVANDFAATDVEGALAELQADAEADASALSDHISDATAAHAASAIAFTPTGTIAATDVQAAIEEVSGDVGTQTAPTLTINAQTGTTYTLVLGDAGKLVECGNASAVTLTVPPNSSAAFPVGTVIYVDQSGAGQVTIAAGAGVTLRTPNGAKSAAQWSQLCLTQRAADDWIVSGDSTT